MARSEKEVGDTSASTAAGVKELRSRTSGIGFTTPALLNCCGPESEAAEASDFSASGPLYVRVLDPDQFALSSGIAARCDV